MMEQEYLEMVNQLKDKYDEITDKLDRIELLELDMKKDLITAYGVVRMLDNLISNSHIPYDNEVVTIVEVLRGLLSNCMDRHIFHIEDG
tara:strand:- start:496 stop:762 length:267 start_codon:yes stop_codon:yes gene_type:complete